MLFKLSMKNREIKREAYISMRLVAKQLKVKFNADPYKIVPLCKNVFVLVLKVRLLFSGQWD